MKVITIGCTHAGTFAVKNIARLYPDSEITIYERNDNISFLSCGIALYVEGIVKEAAGLFYSSPEELKTMGIKTNMQHDVISLDTKTKTVIVKNLITGEQFTDSYDKLVVTTGSWPICPPFEGRELENILLCKNYDHAKDIIEKSNTCKNVTIIGAGYIGVELIEAFEQQGKNVTVIDIETRILAKYMDKEFTDMAEEQYKGKKIKLALGEKVLKFEGVDGKVTTVITDKGRHEADLVILCIGFKPNTEIFKGKVDMLPNGAILVDEYMHTSDDDIVAAGDCCAVYFNPTNSYMYIPLATNAVRMGSLAAINLLERKVKQIGTQGTSGIKIYDELMGSTGLTEEIAKTYFENVQSVFVKDNYRPEFMPTFEQVSLKLVYKGDTRELIGAQITSKGDFTQTINTLSVCIYNKMTIDEVAYVDQFFQPHFNKPWNLINSAALTAK